jgi:hypothetical protein
MSYAHNIDSDLKSAVDYNPGLDLNDVDSVVAALYGENDGADYYWILKMKDGTYGLGQGGCDYTGWDCQSNFEFTPTETAEEAVALCPEKEDRYSSSRAVQSCLTKQLEGTQPFGSMDGEDY